MDKENVRIIDWKIRAEHLESELLKLRKYIFKNIKFEGDTNDCDLILSTIERLTRIVELSEPLIRAMYEPIKNQDTEWRDKLEAVIWEIQKWRAGK